MGNDPTQLSFLLVNGTSEEFSTHKREQQGKGAANVIQGGQALLYVPPKLVSIILVILSLEP